MQASMGRRSSPTCLQQTLPASWCTSPCSVEKRECMCLSLSWSNGSWPNLTLQRNVSMRSRSCTCQAWVLWCKQSCRKLKCSMLCSKHAWTMPSMKRMWLSPTIQITFGLWRNSKKVLWSWFLVELWQNSRVPPARTKSISRHLDTNGKFNPSKRFLISPRLKVCWLLSGGSKWLGPLRSTTWAMQRSQWMVARSLSWPTFALWEPMRSWWWRILWKKCKRKKKPKLSLEVVAQQVCSQGKLACKRAAVARCETPCLVILPCHVGRPQASAGKAQKDVIFSFQALAWLSLQAFMAELCALLLLAFRALLCALQASIAPRMCFASQHG